VRTSEAARRGIANVGEVLAKLDRSQKPWMRTEKIKAKEPQYCMKTDEEKD